MKRPLACFVLALSACSEPADRPETIGICQDEGCEGAYPPAKGNGADDTSSDTTSTTGGSTGDGITLRGNVLVHLDDGFIAVDSWPNDALIRAPGAEDAVVEGQWDGRLFRVDQVARRQAAWVWVGPGDGSLISPMPALHALNTVSDDDYDLALVNREVIELIYVALTVQTTILDDHAQVVLRLIDDQQEPVPGVGIQTSEGEFIAYHDGTTWSDEAVTTDPTGLVMIGNVVAPEYPGRGIQVVVAGAEDTNHVVDVAEGAVTLASLTL